MPDSVMGGYSLPPVDLMSMLLEGPKSYFGRRGSMADQLYLMNQAQQMRGSFADSLLASPVYRQALANPTDRAAQYGLWALGQHGPEAIANEAGNWLQQQLGAANQQAAQAQAAANQTAQTYLEDRLARGRISFSTDEQLRQYKSEAQFNQQQVANQLQSFSAVNPATGQPFFNQQQQQNMTYDFMSKNFGLQARPNGYDVSSDQAGNTFFKPSFGSEAWGKSMDELTPIQMNQGAIQQLDAMLSGKAQWDRATARSLVQTIQDNIRKQGGFGSLDAGTQEAMSKYIADVGGVIGQNNPVGDFNLTARESLRALAAKQDSALQAFQRKWFINPADVGNPYAYKPPEIPPPPKGSADAAVPAPRERGSVGAGGSVGAPNLLGDPAATVKKSREQYQRDKEALKKKFPGAGVR